MVSRKQKIVDRGDLLGGIQKTARDSRLPHNLVRSMENFRLPDQKAVRRDGFGSFITKVNGTTQSRIRGQQLCKHTPTLVDNASGKHPSLETTDTLNKMFSLYRSPLSYGLIKAGDETTRFTDDNDWTLEFLLTVGDEEELVVNAVEREVYADAAKTANTRGDEARQPQDTFGVYVYDQTVLANVCDYEDYQSESARTIGKVAGNSFFTIALPAMAISYRKNSNGKLQISVAWAMWNGSADSYFFHKLIYVSSGAYAAGTVVHVAVAYGNSARVAKLYVDGALVSGTEDKAVLETNAGSSLVLPANEEWAGDNDDINDLKENNDAPVRRDTVILNEFTARGNYGSTCKSNGVQGSLNTFIDNRARMVANGYGSPWACSPPRGTCMAELRWWAEERTVTEINDNKYLRIWDGGEGQPADLKGYWPLDDGGGICRDLVGSNFMTLHHNVAQYINDSGLLNSIGLSLRDGQHLIRSYQDPLNTNYIRDEYAELKRVFQNRRINVVARDPAVDPPHAKYFNPDQDFTIQIQFRTPKQFQRGISVFKDLAGGTIVDAPGLVTTAFPSPYNLALVDGATRFAGTAERKPFADTAGNDREEQFHAPFMETLFSIEGVARDQRTRFPAVADNRQSLSRVPITRGLIEYNEVTGKAKLIFEFYSAGRKDAIVGIDKAEPRYHKLTDSIGAHDLVENTVYTATFRKRTVYGSTHADGASGGTSNINPLGCNLEIFLDVDTLNASVALNDSSPCEHQGDYDIIIGSSYVNNILDQGLTSGIAAFLRDRGEVVQHQHFMNQYMDQPGFFILGFFRLWSYAVPEGTWRQYESSTMIDSNHQAGLVFNLEVEKSTGSFIRNKARYDADFKLGFKSFGAASADGFSGTGPFDISSHVQGNWAMEDCLGYAPLPLVFVPFESDDSVCTAIATYKNTKPAEFGIVTMFDSIIMKDEQVNGQFVTEYLPSHGLLNEYVVGHPWHPISVDKRTFFFGEGGFPKVYNGEHFTRVGLSEWNAGQVYIEHGGYAGGNLDDSKTLVTYYGFRIVYISEEFDLIAASPQFLGIISPHNISLNTSKLIIRNLSPHPDPRCTGIYIYRTIAYNTKAEALTAPTFLIQEGPLANKVVYEITITKDDTELIGSSLDLEITPVPDVKFAAVLDGQLYLAGDKLNEVAFYRSFPGNPEQFDKITTEVQLDEGLGDSINGMIAAYGAIWIFRANTTWRFDPLDSVTGQLNKINDIGLASSLGLTLLTLPDNGAPVIFMWTRFGPYLFDTSGFKYIGYPLEGNLEDAFEDIEHESVRVVHHLVGREVYVFYKHRGGGITSDRYDRCYVYNYRFNIWYEYTGVCGGIGLSTVINSAGALGSGTFSLAGVNTTQTPITLIGDVFGRLWRWGAQLGDGGQGAGGTSGETATVLSWASVAGEIGVITLTAPLTGTDYERLWVVVQKVTDSKITNFYIWPIRSFTSTTITLDENYAGGIIAGPFPSPGDTLIIARAPARITFPWDVLDLPHIDKQVNALVTWRDEIWYGRVASDWKDPALAASWSPWEQMADSTLKRHRFTTPFSQNCEAIKLDLVSFALAARLDAYAYDVHYKELGVQGQ